MVTTGRSGGFRGGCAGTATNHSASRAKVRSTGSIDAGTAQDRILALDGLRRCRPNFVGCRGAKWPGRCMLLGPIRRPRQLRRGSCDSQAAPRCRCHPAAFLAPAVCGAQEVAITARTDPKASIRRDEVSRHRRDCQRRPDISGALAGAPSHSSGLALSVAMCCGQLLHRHEHRHRLITSKRVPG